MLLDLIRSHAALMQKQRPEHSVDGVRCITATEEDFTEAARLYTALNGECGGQMTKLTRREAELITVIHQSFRPELTVHEIQQMTGWNNSTIHKLLNGYLSRGQSYSGLLAKCPAISFLDRSVTTGDESRSTHRRNRVYFWDPVLYNAWIAGGAVWLDSASGDEPGPDDPGPSDDDIPAGGSAGKDGCLRRDAGDCRPEKTVDNGDNNKICTNTKDLDLRAAYPDSMKQGGTSDETGDLSPPDPQICRIAAQHDHPASSESPISDSGPDRYADIPAQTEEAAAPAAHLRICPDDFIAVEGWPQKKPCVVCGRLYTHYQERMTRDRISGQPRENRMLCSICFEAAQVRQALAVRTIPGGP